MFCDPSLKGTTIQGRTVWRNPKGYLLGKIAPFMTLYGFIRRCRDFCCWWSLWGTGLLAHAWQAQDSLQSATSLAIVFRCLKALELVEHLGNINDFSGKTKLLLVLKTLKQPTEKIDTI
ncbi:integral to membrane [Spatholobus suberectus]|nr:integral to membrane [Spatholobus suberectus]